MRKQLINKLFLLLLCGAIFAPAVYAETTIGVIMTGDIPYYQSIHEAFVKSMEKEPGINIVLQKPTPEPMSWANAARKLVVIGSDIIIAYGAPATLTVMKETSDIPIIFAGVYDPEAMNITGKNATGISSKISLDKVLTDFKSIKDFSSLGIIFNKVEKDTILQVMEIKRYEPTMKFKIALFDARRKGFAGGITGVDALLLTTSCTAQCGINDVISKVRQSNIPTASTIGGGEKSGIILTVTASPLEQGTAVGSMTKKLLGGATVSSIAPQSPKKIDLIVNIKEAKSLSLKIPDALLKEATRVIE